MLLIVAVTFGAFWVWRVIGARMTLRGRGASAAGYQVVGTAVFLFGAFLGLQRPLQALAPDGSPPALTLAVTTLVPLGCGFVGAGFVLLWVSLLRPVAPRAKAPVSNPFDVGG